MPKPITEQDAGAIWKYPLRLEDEQIVEMPLGSVLLHAERVVIPNGQGRILEGGIYMWIWAQVYTKALLDGKRRILIRGTGQPFDGTEKKYVCSVRDGDFIWHIYDGGTI